MQPTANLVAYYGIKLKGAVVSDNLLTIPYLFLMSGVVSTDYADYPLIYSGASVKCKNQATPQRCIGLISYLISDEYTQLSVYIKNLIIVKYQGKMTVFN